MAGNFTLPTVLANLTAGNQALSLVDGDFNALANPLLALGTFSNFYSDTGAANAYAITVSAPQTVAQSAGLRVQFIATNANTGASTLTINALTTKNIKNIDGTALSPGQIRVNGVADVIYDGTQYLLLNPAAIGPTNFAMVDGSTASLTFTGVSVSYTQANNLVSVYGTLVYPNTASASLAAVTLPVAVPNVAYAHVPSVVFPVGAAAASFTPVMIPIKNTSTAGLYNPLLGAGSQQANSIFSLTTLTFMCVYPAS